MRAFLRLANEPKPGGAITGQLFLSTSLIAKQAYALFMAGIQIVDIIAFIQAEYVLQYRQHAFGWLHEAFS